MAAYKRLGTNERIKIQSLLDVLQPFSKIAKELGVNKTTISREVKAGRMEHDVRSFGSKNRCVHREDCDKNDLCPGMSKKCKTKGVSTAEEFSATTSAKTIQRSTANSWTVHHTSAMDVLEEKIVLCANNCILLK